MNLKELNEANIINLSALWKKMGIQKCTDNSISTLHSSVSWPYRCWFDWETNAFEISFLDKTFNELDNNYIVPVWGGLAESVSILEKTLIDYAFEISFEQTAMYLNLENYDILGQHNLEVSTITSEQDVEIWTNIAAESFGYVIDVSVIHKIANTPDVELLLAYIDDQPAATAMLFRTGDIIGVHQVGVLQKYREKGVARVFMQYIIERCIEQTAKYITLQASVEGESLYRKLGFEQQFMIQNYQRISIKLNKKRRII